MFPPQFARDAILNLTRPGDLVLDSRFAEEATLRLRLRFLAETASALTFTRLPGSGPQ